MKIDLNQYNIKGEQCGETLLVLLYFTDNMFSSTILLGRSYIWKRGLRYPSILLASSNKW